jgi:hypothetical protein
MRLQCLSLGPRSKGRDYGLLPRFRATPLPGTAARKLGDFAMALLEWGLQPRAEFAACFPLDDRQSLTFLVRVAYLGREALGPVVIGNGLLIDAAAVQAVDGKPHRFLGAIQPPSSGEWTETELQLEAPSAPVPGIRVILGELSRSLEISDEPAVIELADDTIPTEAVAEIIESTWIGGGPMSWVTTRDLTRIESFKPADFRLVAHAVDPQSTRAAGAARLQGDRIEGELPQPSRLLRLCHALGLPRPQSIALESSVSPPAQPDSELRSLLVAQMQQSMRSAADDAALFRLVDRWLAGSETVPPEDRHLAQMAIAVAFRGLVEDLADPERQTALISGYCRDVWARLEHGPRELPAALAARLNLLPGFSEAQLEWLLDHGLVGSFSRDTRTAIRGGGFTRGQIAAVARVLRRRLEEGGGGDGDFAEAVVESAVSRAELESKALAPEEEDVLALCETALLAEPEAPRWANLAKLMARALRLRLLRRDGPDPRFEAVRLAFDQALSPGDSATFRRVWVAVGMLQFAQGGAE